MFGEGDDVFWAFAQWRNAKLELAEAVKEIAAEAAGLDCGFEILIGGGDDAHINVDVAIPAETVKGLAVENTKQLDLHLQLQFADFVEEKCAFVGEFEKAGLGGIGSAEGSFFITEQFAFDQIFRGRGPVAFVP